MIIIGAVPRTGLAVRVVRRVPDHLPAVLPARHQG